MDRKVYAASEARKKAYDDFTTGKVRANAEFRETIRQATFAYDKAYEVAHHAWETAMAAIGAPE